MRLARFLPRPLLDLIGGLILWEHDFVRLVRRVAREFNDDHCTQLAASISYYVLFSFFPLAILAVSIIGLVSTDPAVREQVIDAILDLLPVSIGAGREQLESVLDPISRGRSAIGLISVFGLLWSATGMMAALRHALDQAWDLTFRRPFIRGKLVDVALVAAVSVFLAGSFAVTLFVRATEGARADIEAALGGVVADVAVQAAVVILPGLLTFATFTAIFKLVPSIEVRLRDALPGAFVAAVLFEALKNGFAFYLANFASYDLVYGSLGALIALLFFVYLGALVLLLGAEISSEWPRVFRGHTAEEIRRATGRG